MLTNLIYTISGYCFQYIVILLFLGFSFSFASGQTDSLNVLPDKKPGKDERSFGFHNLADRIDSFFSDQRIEEELQTSSLRIKPGLEWREGARFKYPLPVRINLVLPRLQNRWQILFANLPDADNDQDPDNADYTENQPVLEDQKTASSFLGLQFAPVTQFYEHLKFFGGVKIRIDKLNPFGMVRFRYGHPLGEWNLRFVQSAFWFKDTGIGEISQLDVGRPINDETLFRSRSAVIWSELSAGVDLKQTFYLRHFLTEDIVTGIYWRIGGHTSPHTILDGHTVAIEFRSKLWVNWLYFQFSPQVQYLRRDNFRALPVFFSDIEFIL